MPLIEDLQTKKQGTHLYTAGRMIKLLQLRHQRSLSARKTFVLRVFLWEFLKGAAEYAHILTSFFCEEIILCLVKLKKRAYH